MKTTKEDSLETWLMNKCNSKNKVRHSKVDDIIKSSNLNGYVCLGLEGNSIYRIDETPDGTGELLVFIAHTAENIIDSIVALMEVKKVNYMGRKYVARVIPTMEVGLKLVDLYNRETKRNR